MHCLLSASVSSVHCSLDLKRKLEPVTTEDLDWINELTVKKMIKENIFLWVLEKNTSLEKKVFFFKEGHAYFLKRKKNPTTMG